MLPRSASFRSIARLATHLWLLVTMLCATALGAQKPNWGVGGPPPVWKSVTAIGVVNGKEVRTCLRLMVLKNPADDFQPGSEVEAAFQEAEDADYPNRLWTRKEGPRWSHDCVGHVMLTNWKTNKYKVGAPKFFKEIVQVYGWKRAPWEGFQPGDVVAWVKNGEAQHVAVVTNSAFSMNDVLISSKDNERSTFEGPLKYQESRVLRHPLNTTAYPDATIEIWHVRHLRFEESDCGSLNADGKYVLQSVLVDPNKSAKVQNTGGASPVTREWRVGEGSLSFHSASKNPAGEASESGEFIGKAPAELLVGTRMAVGVRGRVVHSADGVPHALREGTYPDGAIPNMFLDLHGAGSAIESPGVEVKNVGHVLTFEGVLNYEVTGGRDPLVISMMFYAGQAGAHEVTRYVYSWVGSGASSTANPSLNNPPARDSTVPPNAPPVVVVDAKPPAAASFASRLVAKHSNRCLDIAMGEFGTANGAIVHQWDCINVRSQVWTFRSTFDAQWFQIHTGHVQKCLDVDKQGTGNNTRLLQWDCNISDSQLWRMVERGQGTFALVSKLANRCIDIFGVETANGAVGQLYDCHFGPNQLWTIAEVPPTSTTPPTGTTPPPGTTPSTTTGSTAFAGRLLAMHSTRCLDIAGGDQSGRSNGEVAHQWDCLDVRSQEWTFRSTPDGQWFQLLTGHSQKCLDIDQQRTSNNAKLHQWDCDGGDSQLWKVVDRGQGTFALVSKLANRCIDIFGAGTANGAVGQLYECHYGPNQVWSLARIPLTPATTPPPPGGPRSDIGVTGAWRYRLTCGATEFEGTFTLMPNADGTLAGRGDGPWDPGTVTVSAGIAKGNQLGGLKLLPDAWVEPFTLNGQFSNSGADERVDGEAHRSSGACRFFMDRNAGPVTGFDPLGDWRYTSTCSPRTTSGVIRVAPGANGKYIGRFAGPWEGVPAGDIWDARVYGREVSFNFRPDGWNEHYRWKGSFADGKIDGQVLWRGQAACTFSLRR